ncbi:MAG TPA: POTRA domain-containing protein, partial [Cyclobacteriaceae bacterium]|nr:POTRA domain-containing protein [Cyclobacteriaceae bacterium]
MQKANDRLGPLPISVGVALYYKGKKNYSKEKFFKKRQKAEKKFDKKIAATKSEKKIANLQYRKQNKIDAINKKIDNGNLFMQWGEPIAVFDTSAMHQSKDKIVAFLFNRGYFQAKVNDSFKEGRKKRIAVKYTIIPGPLFVYDTIFYNIPDQKVANLVSKNIGLSLIKKGDAYDQDKLGKERD